MYQPTEKELLEMEFAPIKFVNVVYKWIYKDTKFLYFVPIREFGFDLGDEIIHIYPRSKEHLEQIILAFKP